MTSPEFTEWQAFYLVQEGWTLDEDGTLVEPPRDKHGHR